MKVTFKIISVRILLTIMTLSSGYKVFAQDKPFLKNATVFLVRHAEKDTGNNPAISKMGRERAGHLVAALEGNSIQKIFVSQFRRTQQTADSLRIKTKADTVHYNADANGDDLIKTLEIHKIKNEKILIIGHSNTIPILIGRLGITKPVFIRDDEYNTLYLIKYVKGVPMLFSKKFGDPALQEANSSWDEVL